jgi:poly(3-hydroxybutyrate) depolymerase
MISALALSTVFAASCGTGSGDGSGTAGTNGTPGTGASKTSGVAATTGQGGQAAGTSGQAGTAGGQRGGTGGSATGSAGTTGTAGSTGGAGPGTAGTGGSANAGTGGGPAGAAGAGGGYAGSSAGRGGRGGGGGTVGAGGSSAGAGGATGAAGRGGSGGTATGGAGGSAAAGSGGSGTPGMSSGCGKAPGIASSMYNNGSRISFMSGSQQRRYILNVPTNYDNTHPYRLIITYHELNGNDVEMYNQKYYNLLPASNNTAIFIAPNGSQSGGPCSGTGSGDSGCGWPNSNNVDLTFVDALVKSIEDNFCIDTNRIFADGWSYGGSMSYKTACERPLGGVSNGYIRGVAVYSGSQLSGNCTPSKPVAYYASHGTHDSVLNYSNGVGLAQNFAKANGCTWATPTSVTSGAHVCTNEMGCMAGYPLEFCSFNGDHTPFPDNGQESSSWNAANVWTFFSQF